MPPHWCNAGWKRERSAYELTRSELVAQRVALGVLLAVIRTLNSKFWTIAGHLMCMRMHWL